MGKKLTVTVRRESDPKRKRELQRHLTKLLPEWFGKGSANVHYADMAETLEGYVAEIDGTPRGLLSLKWTGPRSAEIYWMGVEPAFHRHGVGRGLVEMAAKVAREHGRRYLLVSTLHPDVPYEPYQRTRRFYEGLGFEFVLEEQFPADPGNPLAIYLKELTT
jgi:ribosomal protein S18 acetylase RimI-like enzyme